MTFRSSAILFAVASLVVACSSSTNSSTSNGDGGTGTAASAQKLPVGSPCTKDSDCGTSPFFCQQGDHPGGYCMRDCDIKNGDADCPSEAICQFDGTKGECHKKCGSQTDCRTGYVCSPASTSGSMMASHSFCDVADMGMNDGGMDMDSGGMDMDSGMNMDSGGMNMDSGMGMD